MNLGLGDRLVWDGVVFELIAYDAASARLRAVDEGYVRVVLINELQRDPSVEWPQREVRQVRTFDPQSLKALPLPQLNRPDFCSVLQARMELDEQGVFAGDA